MDNLDIHYYRFRLKPTNFDCEWTSEDDSRLLRGIYQHGMGSWEAIQMDASLKLGDKIFPNDSKAQLKRVNARAEYLLKVLKKQMDLKLGVVKSFYMQYVSNPFLLFPFTSTGLYPSSLRS